MGYKNLAIYHGNDDSADQKTKDCLFLGEDLHIMNANLCLRMKVLSIQCSI